MLTVLLGRAGAGKTETCLRAALEALRQGPDGPPLVLLAPEQATYQLERALLDRLPDGAAVARLQVLSFRRLALRVLEEVGGLARPRLGEAGRRMLLRAVLRERRAELWAWGQSADRPGLAAALDRQLAELEAYALSPERLRAAAEGAPPRTAARLHDLALLWEAYRARLGDRLADPASDLALAAAALPASSLARATVWADGFAGFTVREEQCLGAWLAAGARLTVALCLDGREWLHSPRAAWEDPSHPFSPTRRTLDRLLRLHPTAEVVCLDGDGPPRRFAAGGDLARLEAGLWWSAQASAAEDPAGASKVYFLEAPDPAAEVRAAADEIDRLCREEGYRRREIAIVLRDLEAYHDLVAATLGARGIPVFVDRPRPAGRHPVPAALLAALEVITSGWSLEAVRRYLHTDLCGLGRGQADELENWALAHGIRGPSWYRPEPVGGEGRGAHRADRLRRRMAGPVRRLELALAPGADPPPTGAAAAAACLGWLREVRAPETVARWIDEAEAQGLRDEAEWHRLCWQAAMGLLDQLALALGDDRVGPEEVLQALQAGLEGLRVALVPPRLDEVLCGAVGRSRHPELRAAFVLGMADGAFPPAPPEGPLLEDADRLALRAAGLELAPTAGEQLWHERYLGYIALTRARERLYLSWPAGPGPAPLVRRVQEVLGHARPWPACPEPTARRGVRALAAEVAVQLGRARELGLPLPPEWEAARRWLLHRPDGAAVLAAALGAGAPRPAALPADLAARLYPAETTASALEAAAACAFQHFARHGLRLRRREVAEVDQGHLGELLHAALAGFVRGILREGADLASLEEAEALRRAAAALEEARDHVLGRLPPGSARGRWLLWAAGRDLERAVLALVAHARAGAYRPKAAEWEFLRGGLRGRVDRVDEAVDAEGRRHVRVVDYKTGQARFDLRRFAHGLDLALPLYLAAAAEGAVPGGCFVLAVRDELDSAPGPDGGAAALPRLQGLAPARADQARLHERDLDGTVLGVRWVQGGRPRQGSQVADPDQFALVLRALDRRVGRLRAKILSGDIDPDPWRLGPRCACQECEFLDVCGFDRGRGDRFRALEERPLAAVWQLLEAEEAAGDA